MIKYILFTYSNVRRLQRGKIDNSPYKCGTAAGTLGTGTIKYYIIVIFF